MHDEQQQVFVVDDDPGMLESTVWLLESVGLRAHAFTDGRAFLEACQPDTRGCLLLDVRMPGLGGLGVQEALQERGIRLPVIFVSGHADVPIVVRAFRAGAVDFIEKPYNEQLLLDSVQQALAAQPPLSAPAWQAVQQRLARLTPRERDVLLPLVKGHTNREVAAQLHISIKTVDLYRARVMKRLQAAHLPALVAMALGAGLVEPLELIQGPQAGSGAALDETPADPRMTGNKKAPETGALGRGKWR